MPLITMMVTSGGTVLDIDLEAIVGNVRELARVANVDVFAVVKGDAYGHGAEASGWAALEGGARMLAVFSVDEGLALRQRLQEADVLVLLGALDGQEARAALDASLILTVWDNASASLVSREAVRRGRTARVHFKVDTGMTRLGAPTSRAAAVYEAIRDLPAIEIEGIFTHLANANELVDNFSDVQLARFTEVLEAIGSRPRWVHAAASSVARTPGWRAVCNAVRPGRAIFGPGLAMVDDPVNLRPALTWKSSVARVERVPSGTPVSYGGTYRTARATQIATVPVGYGHGLPRSGTSKLRMLVAGELVPVVGRVTMDSVMLDVGARTVARGDEVIVVGTQGGACQTALEVADACGTIVEELTTRIAPRVPRRYFYQGQLVGSKTLVEGFTWR